MKLITVFENKYRELKIELWIKIPGLFMQRFCATRVSPLILLIYFTLFLWILLSLYLFVPINYPARCSFIINQHTQFQLHMICENECKWWLWAAGIVSCGLCEATVCVPILIDGQGKTTNTVSQKILFPSGYWNRTSPITRKCRQMEDKNWSELRMSSLKIMISFN